PRPSNATCDSAAPVAVLQSDHIVEMRSRCLEDVDVGDRFDAMYRVRPDADALAFSELDRLERIDALSDDESHAATQQVHRLILDVVILERERVARVHVQDLADIVFRVGPDQLVSPRLVHASRDAVLRHIASPVHSNVTRTKCRLPRWSSMLPPTGAR